MFIVWSILLVLSLFFLVKSADYFVDSSKSIGDYFKLPKFITGILLVGIGTSLPELASSLVSVTKGVPEMVLANVIGSNIANTFLIVGFTAVLAKNIRVTKTLIDLDIPLMLLSTTLFVFVAFDGNVSFSDSIFLLAGLLYYMVYSLSSREKSPNPETGTENDTKVKKEFLIALFSLFVLVLSAKLLVESVLRLGELLSVPVTSLTLFVVALGTSLPELFVSISSVKKGHADMALGNVFGSNAFNLLAVGGLSALFANLPMDKITFSVALPALVASAILFAFSGISKRINMFEGIFFIIIYIFIIMKIFNQI